MIRAFNALNDKAKGVTKAQRHRRRAACRPITPPRLKRRCVEVSGGKTVKVNVNVDPSIIGGIVVKLGSRMVDASLKTKLNSLRTRMKEVG